MLKRLVIAALLLTSVTCALGFQSTNHNEVAADKDYIITI